MKKKIYHIAYAAGPGDIITTYRHWKKNEEDPAIPGLTDSGQFFDLIQEMDNAKALVISSCQRPDSVSELPFILKQIPKKQGSGLAFHMFHILYGLRICYEMIRFRANLAIIEEGTSHWFVWNILHLFGIRIIPSLKCTLWPEFRPLSLKQKFINFLDRPFFKKKAQAILSMSSVINKQIESLTHSKHAPILNFLPIYQKTMFANIPFQNPQQSPFTILFIGRIEKFKGVFDILEIAKTFKEKQLQEIHFKFCGRGSSLDELSAQIVALNLSETCHLLGYCNQDQLKIQLSQSHVVIVPSRTVFVEGYCMVVVEGVLAGRPVITSKVCPAIYDVLPAVCEAQPDDIQSYTDAILKLYQSKEFYQTKQKACSQVSAPFYDINNSWGKALKSAIDFGT